MERLYYQKGKLERIFEVPFVEGIVKESQLVNGAIQKGLVPQNGLKISLDNGEDTFIFLDAKFRVDSGERVRIYATNMIAKGLQVLNPKGDKVLFQYREGPNLEYKEI